MEKRSQRNLPLCFSLAEVVGFFILDVIVVTLRRLEKFCSRSLGHCISSRIHSEGCKMYVVNKNTEDPEPRRIDFEMVLNRIGIPLAQEGNQMTTVMGNCDEFSAMFDEDEPSLEEVKEAFNVFDGNRDGFIDATELQTVLRKLGLKEGTDWDACHMMIAAHDQNQDGRMDFNEFVKFMENAF